LDHSARWAWRLAHAIAALAGAAVVVIGDLLHISPTATTILGALLCFGLRLMAIHHGWHLPVAGRPERPAAKKHIPDDEAM
jgi:uncharacterized membrane protein YeiH